MIGMVLYSRDGLTDWRLNGIHCKAGYIVIKRADNLPATIDYTVSSKRQRLLIDHS